MEFAPVHVYPTHLDLDDIVHTHGDLVRIYHEAECACCKVGRCWQRIDRTVGAADLVVHGLNLQN
jgi:hypothetical protein